MIRLSVMYAATAETEFDMAYYKTTHAALIAQKLTGDGFVRFEIDAGVGGGRSGDSASYVAIGHLVFADMGAFQRLMKEHGRSINEDVPNFTTIKPVVQVSEMIV